MSSVEMRTVHNSAKKNLAAVLAVAFQKLSLRELKPSVFTLQRMYVFRNARI